MRVLLQRLLVAIGMTALLAGTLAVPPASAADDDILKKLEAIPGVSFVQEKPVDGYRYFVMTYKQDIDHRHPDKGTFEQRFTVLNKDTDRPTVFFTSGYNVSTTPSRSEPTKIVDGNQISLEYRFFTPSRPSPADWSKLDIWQAASDQHALYEALKPVYGKNWLATGGSKGGMTATYYERFYPHDMDGTVAYVAPNDVVNNEDSAYDKFFTKVGTTSCRDKLDGVQREALVRRSALKKLYQAYADKNGYTFNTVGDLDKAYEAVVLDYVWGFWQYYGLPDCDKIPSNAKKATDQQIYDSIDTYSGFEFYTDQGLEPYTPYYYQAGTQLGSPDIHFPYIEKGLIKYGYGPPRHYVPRSIPMKFDPSAMRHVDSWVRSNARHTLWVYGSADPWGAERFRVGKHAHDAYVYTAPGMNHGANVAGLVAKQRDFATARILSWGGVASSVVKANPASAEPLAAKDAQLDRHVVRQGPLLG